MFTISKILFDKNLRHPDDFQTRATPLKRLMMRDMVSIIFLILALTTVDAVHDSMNFVLKPLQRDCKMTLRKLLVK